MGILRKHLTSKTKTIKGKKAENVKKLLNQVDNMKKGDSLEFMGMLFTKMI